jgi:hypothetical protein
MPGKVPPVAAQIGRLMTLCAEDFSGRRNANPNPI